MKLTYLYRYWYHHLPKDRRSQPKHSVVLFHFFMVKVCIYSIYIYVCTILLPSIIFEDDTRFFFDCPMRNWEENSLGFVLGSLSSYWSYLLHGFLAWTCHAKFFSTTHVVMCQNDEWIDNNGPTILVMLRIKWPMLGD